MSDKDDLQQLAGEIGKIIADNRKFLSRVMEEDFEPEEPEEEEPATPEEL